MAELKAWMPRQLDDHLVEPNSGLGVAINFMLKHWEKLTLFLRVPGAPIDNTLCERALKKVIMHRKNALFYKTLTGGRRRLVHEPHPHRRTQRHRAPRVPRRPPAAPRGGHRDPRAWLPWTYEATLTKLRARVSPSG